MKDITKNIGHTLLKAVGVRRILKEYGDEAKELKVASVCTTIIC